MTCKIYSDMQCTVRVFDPTEDLNALALVGVGQKLLLNKEKDNSNAKSLGGYKNPGLTAKPGATSEKKRIVATSSGSAGLISPGVNLLAAPASTTAPPLLGYLGSRICGADSSACNMVPPPTGSLTPPRTPPKFSPNRNKGTPGRSVGSGTVGNLNATLSLLGTAEKQCNVHSSANSIASLSTASFFDSDDEFGSVGGGSVHGFTPRAHISQSSDNEEDFTEQRVTTPIEVHSVECCITDNVLPADTFRVLIENYTFRPSSISLVENQFVSFVAHSRDKHQLTCTRMSPRRDQIAESEFEVQLEGYGNSYVHHFAVPGKYLVKDEIFQFMSLYVTVLPDVEDASDDDTVDSVGFDNDLDEEEEDETKLKAEFNRERITKKKQGQRILHQHRHWANDTAGANCSSLLPKPAWNFPMTDTLLDEDTLRYVEKKYGTSSSKKLLSPTGSSPLFNSTKENYSVHSARLNSTCFDTSAKLNLHGSFFVGVNEMKNKQNQGDLEADGALGEMEFDEDWEAESVDTAEGHNGLEEQNYIENQLSQGYTEFVDDEEPPPPYSSEPEAAPTCPIVEVHSNKISPTHLRGENRDPAVYCKPTLQSLTEVVLPNPTNFDRLSCPSHSESSPPPYERNVKVSAAKDAYADDADTYSMKGFYGYYAKQQKEHRNIKAEGLEKSSDDDYEYDEAYPTSRATFSEKLPLLSNHEESLELLRKHLSGLEPGNPSWNERKSNQSPGQCSKPVSLLQNPSFSARNRNNYFVGANTVNPDRATAQEIEDYNRLYTKHVEEIEMKSLARYNSQIDDSISKQSLNMGIQACAVPKTAVGVGVTNNGSREQCIVEDAATSNTSLSAGSKRRARRKKIALAQANKVLDGCGTERCNNDTGLSPGIKLESVTPNHSGSNAIVIAEGRDTNVNANLSSPKADSDVDKFIVFNALNSNSGSLSNVSISSNASKLIGVSNSAKTRHASVSSNIAKSVDVSKLASNDSVAVSAASTVMTTSVVTSSVISNSKSTLLSPVTVAPSVSVFSVEEKLKVVTASGSELKIKKKKKKKKQAAEEDTIPPVCSKDTLLALEKEALAPAPALVANDSSADDDHRKQHRTLSAADDNVPKPVQLQALSRNGLISSKKKAKQVQNQTVPDSIASRDVTSDAGASGKANADISSGAVVDDEVETVDAVELFFMNRKCQFVILLCVSLGIAV